MSTNVGTLTPALIASYQEQLKHPNDSKAGLVNGLGAFFITISTLALALRLYARTISHTKYGWDDTMAIISWFLATALGVCALITAPTIRHVVFLKKHELERCLRTFYAAQYIYGIATSAYKAAFLHYYARIFTTYRARVLIRTTLVLVWATCVACMFVILFQCRPINHAWELLVVGTCIDTSAFVLATAIIGIILDLIILILPMPFVWNLQLSRAKRFSISGVFFVGAVVLVSSIMRAVYIKGLVISADTADPMWTNIVPALWSLIELFLGATCVCLPSIWPLIIRAKRRARNWSMCSTCTLTTNNSRSTSGKRTPGMPSADSGKKYYPGDPIPLRAPPGARLKTKGRIRPPRPTQISSHASVTLVDHSALRGEDEYYHHLV